MMIRSRSGPTCLRSVLAASLVRPSSSSGISSPLTTRRTASIKAGRLASAAHASSTDSALNPPAPPQSPSTWASPTSYLEDAVDDLSADQPDQPSREKRLSAVGLASLWHRGGPVAMPSSLREAMEEMLSGGDRKLLRSDVKRVLEADAQAPMMKKDSQRSRAAMLHLALSSPQRYATIHQVLKMTAERLARPLPALGNAEEEPTGWSPKRVVEMGCAAGEGAWAAAEVWPGLEQWSGNDNRPYLLIAAEDLINFDAKTDEPSPLGRLRKNKHSAVELEANKSHYMRYRRFASDQQAETKLPPEDTLNLSSYQLLSLPSDTAREHHVRGLWNSGAETIVLIEEGTDRGFAAIASARALLLELGEEEKFKRNEKQQASTGEDGESPRERMVIDGVEYFEEGPSDTVTVEEPGDAVDPTKRGCYVVAPCPHDRPCPLLHPFMLDLDHKHDSSRGKRSGPSNRHRASAVGLHSCFHPVRYLPPQWARDQGSEDGRRKRQSGGREERSARMAYVVVKRGSRPTLEAMRQSGAEFSQEVGAAVPYTRQGGIEALRKGDSFPRRHPEDIIEVNSEEGDMSMQEDMMELLPPDLQQALKASKAEEAKLNAQISAEQSLIEQAAVTTLAGKRANDKNDDIWRASVDAAEDAREEEKEVDAAGQEDHGDLNKEWLSALSPANQARPEELDVDSVEKPHSARAVASAISLMLPSLPRVVLPPIKKGGHVIFDACHLNGSIQRYTIARSVGKQVYHEVRKISWADQWGQDPVEAAAITRPAGADEEVEGTQGSEGDNLSPLETRDEATGTRIWIKRRGWGQWSRVAPADPSAGLAKDGTGSPLKSSSSIPGRKTRASDRPSALIGADQVCPLTSKSRPQGFKRSPTPSAFTTSGAAGQRGPHSQKVPKWHDTGLEKEPKRKRNRDSYSEEAAAAVDELVFGETS